MVGFTPLGLTMALMSLACALMALASIIGLHHLQALLVLVPQELGVYPLTDLSL